MGGMETYSYQVVESLSGSVSLALIKLHGNPDGTSPGGVKLAVFGISTAFRLLTGATKYDVVHGFDIAIWPLAWIATWSGKASAVVLSAHGTDVAYAFRKSMRGRLYGAYCRFGARILSRAKVLANSEATAELAGRLGFAHTVTIPLAAQSVDVGAVQVKERILFPGRLMSRKGCGWFVKNVFPALPEGLRVAIAGRRDEAEEDWVLQHACVDYLGVLDTEAFLQECAAAICVVVPNRDFGVDSFEGFGLVAPEAAAVGGVVLASDLFGLKSAIRDGVTGFLLDPDDVQGWVNKINEVRGWTEDRRAQFIVESKAYAQKHYSWERVARETLASYQSALTDQGTHLP